MKILMLHMQPLGVGWFRHWLPARALLKSGVEVTHHEAHFSADTSFSLIGKGSDTKVERWILDNLKNYDLVHMGYSTILEHVQISVVMREYARVPIVVDCDDDINHVPRYNKAYAAYHSAAQERKVARMHFRLADAMSVSTPPLAASLKGDCRRVEVLPNCHYPSPWEQLQVDPTRASDKSIRFMFAGGQGRYGDLEEVRVPFERAMQKYDGTGSKPLMRLLFMGIAPEWAAQWIKSSTDPAANRAYIVQPSAFPTYRAVLKWLQPDVFFSPVVCNLFNESKSHIKAYDAAECGAAFLCTDWTTYKDVPTTAAVKVKGDYEWCEAIEQLVEDATLRMKLNQRLVEWSREEWHIDKHIHKWLHYYREVCSSGLVRVYEDVVHPQPIGGVKYAHSGG